MDAWSSPDSGYYAIQSGHCSRCRLQRWGRCRYGPRKVEIDRHGELDMCRYGMTDALQTCLKRALVVGALEGSSSEYMRYEWTLMEGRGDFGLLERMGEDVPWHSMTPNQRRGRSSVSLGLVYWYSRAVVIGIPAITLLLRGRHGEPRSDLLWLRYPGTPSTLPLSYGKRIHDRRKDGMVAEVHRRTIEWPVPISSLSQKR